MQKFAEGDAALSDRENVVVLVDEAHRGQYGFEEKFDRDGKNTPAPHSLIRRALPNATFVRFQRHPSRLRTVLRARSFGDYIDVYDMTQAVEV